MDKLAEICATKRLEIAARKRVHSLRDLSALAAQQTSPRGFEAALRRKLADGAFALIAEIKRASPSKGLIRQNFDPVSHALDYQDSGAACLSILTDHSYFMGHEDYLIAARSAVELPVLRKDFTVDPWQVLEARSIGADAILIIVAALDDALMREIEDAAFQLGMSVLVEVHDEPELDRALKHLFSKLIGVNNRNLKTFETDLTTTERLSALVPPEVMLVAESGITSHADCNRLAEQGVKSFLVGESLMRQPDIREATRKLLRG